MDAMHSAPELSMQEAETSKFIVKTLQDIGGWEIAEGIGKYGIVATKKMGSGSKSVGLRADFDALPIQEDNDLPYKSQFPGKAHLCGHDGHTSMLLGAAAYLAEHGDFNGTLRLIFQPGEETMQGGPAMIEDGLFEKFPVDAVFGMHNMPRLEAGTFVFGAGKFMAAVDNWEITITGKGSHGSMPEQGIDPLVCGASLVMALQTIVSRNVSPWQQAVVNVGAFQSGQAGNVVPQTAVLRLSIRSMDHEVRQMLLQRVREITQATVTAFSCTYSIDEGVPGTVLVNDEAQTQFAAGTAVKTFGEDRVKVVDQASMGSEDFAFMLEKKQGNYCMLGNGDSYILHHPKYVFNQDILPIGAAYWVSLAQEYLK